MKPDTINVDSRYSAPGAEAPAWDAIESTLAKAEVYALTTVLPDSTPHTVPVAGTWTDEGFVFCTGEYEQKAKNIAHNSRGSMHIGSTSFMTGMDIVVRGEFVHHTDAESLTRLAKEFESKYPDFFKFQVGDGALINAHGNRAAVYCLRPDYTHVFTRDDSTVQARYTFEENS